jgi:hypothetical protein
MRVVQYLTLRQVSDLGPDGIQCTGDDTYSAPASLRAFFTTGIARTRIYDSNSGTTTLDSGAPGCGSCITAAVGAPRACNSINGSGGVRNLKLAGALPVIDLDASVGDAAVTVEVECQ